MTIRSLMRHTVAIGLLLLSGCEAARNMRDDFTRLTSSQPTAASQAKAAPPRPRPPATPPSGATSGTPPNSFDIGSAAPTAAPDPPVRSSERPPVALAGKSENELRALFGAPTSEEDRPPGKRWRYRNGQCTLDVQLYPDVQTKQFGTLAYEVKSDDNSDEGRRHCLAQLQSRVQTRN
jgi:hypothetical protein